MDLVNVHFFHFGNYALPFVPSVVFLKNLYIKQVPVALAGPLVFNFC